MSDNYIVMEDFVPYELAKKLKEKEFPQHITNDAYIIDNDGEEEYNIGDRLPIPLIPDYMNDVAAPTISQVLKWLREEKKIFVQISLFEYCYDYCILDTTMVYYDNEHKVLHQGPTGYSYEEAALAGIEYVIDNLI